MNAKEIEAAKLKLLDWGEARRHAIANEHDISARMYEEWLYGAEVILSRLGIYDLATLAMRERESTS